MPSEKIWWYSKKGERFGPHTSEEMKTFAASGEFAPSDMVWKDGLANWIPASSVAGLIPGGGMATPPPISPGPPNAQASGVPASKQKMHVVTKVALWIGGIFLGLIVLGLIFGSDDKSNSSGPQTAPNQKVPVTAHEPSPPALMVGDSFTTPTFEIQVLTAQALSSVGDPMFASRPADGGIYIAIKWSYRNISKKPVSAFSRPTVHLVAPDGTKYDQDLGASASYATELDTNAKVLSDLNPGLRVVDADVFEVSREMFDAKSWKILIEADKNAQIAFETAK